MAKKGIYKIVFFQNNEVYEVYAKSIFQSDLYGFVEVEERGIAKIKENKDKKVSSLPNSDLINKFPKK